MQIAVDVGCGTGNNTRPLAVYFDHVIGVDVSETQISEAKRAKVEENGGRIEYQYLIRNK